MDAPFRLTGDLVPRDAWSAERCSVGRTLEIVSTRSAMLLLREAYYGATRFDDFARRAGISAPVAAARLRELVDAGIFEREDYREAGQRTRQAYRLTEKGADLLPAVVGLMQWGDRWVDDRGGPIALRHRGCGERIAAELRCEAGHLVPTGEIDAEHHLGPPRRPVDVDPPRAA
jgi:DNA-binding HxlR family transcriptional regulator